MTKIVEPKKLLDVTEGAKYLLGCTIVRSLPNGTVLKAKIVETECYHQDDPASHTYSGKSMRNRAMFGPAGHAYIYFTYGMHWCFNVTAGLENYGAGILIRAVEPLEGITIMQQNRHFRDKSAKSTKEGNTTIANGPAKLAQALAIDNTLYGHDLTQEPLQIFEPEDRSFKIKETTRIGISKAVEEIARFYIIGSPYISKK